MEEYAHRQNIKRFERDLLSEADATRRKLFESLLSVERDQLAKVLRGKDGDAEDAET